MSGLRVITFRLFVAAMLVACSDGGATGRNDSPVGAGGAPAGAAGTSSGATAGDAGASAGTSGAGTSGAAGAPGAAGASGIGAVGGAGAMAGAGGDMMLAGTGGVGAAGTDGGASGPEDGDPSAPVVALADVPCRTEADVSGMRVGSSINATIGGRELAIDYPCGKHEGAQMTVILNLHGTLIGGANFLYQRNYFSVYRLIHSHNLIVLTPQSVSTVSYGAQWGNEDGGADLPYLNDLMNWVYTSFAGFQIRSTWIAGHSWGAAYAEGGLGLPGFVCNEMFMDKFKGVVGMSALGIPPCSERVSMIGTRGSEEDFELLDQSSVAMGHGCDVPMKGPEMVGNNERRYFDGCDPGWVHEDYNMLGKGHIDPIDAEVVLKIVESIKSTEL